MAAKGCVRLARRVCFRHSRRIFSTNVRPELSQNQFQNDGKLAEFLGAKAPYTSEMKFLNESSYDPIPIYRVMDRDGQLIDQAQEPNIDKDTLVKMYTTMVQLSHMDKIMYESQRQGRISFYMTNYGEEAMHLGSAAGLQSQDLIYAQYREAGVLLYRGMTVPEMVDQCYGNCDDKGKGKQMPVHYGSKEHNIVTISSPLATQMPQAVGAAYAFKRVPGNDRCVICYFGDGSGSEGDAFSALNFAATLDCPIIFFCRNNGYAISTPASEQYRGDGIASRGPALGLNTVRVDGTDVFAVYNAVTQAREYAVANNRPVLIEAMGYRVGHHSTSDDSTAYRSTDEIQKWANESPIEKLRIYLEKKGYWDSESELGCVKKSKQTVLTAMKASEKKMKPNWRVMFEDVYSDMPPRIQKQMQEVGEHLEKYKEQYPLNEYKSD